MQRSKKIRTRKDYPVSAVAVSLRKEHGFDYDIAYLSAWYDRTDYLPHLSREQYLSAMMMVRHYPKLSTQEAKALLQNYNRKRCG